MQTTSDPSATPQAPPRAWKDFYEPGELVEVSCPMCGARSPEDIASEFGIAVARCGSCELVYTRTPLRESQAHYTVPVEQFFAKYEAVARGRDPHPRDRNYDEILGILEKTHRPADLLDVGSHCGFFLRRAKARGWRTTGVEPSSTSSSLARDWFGLEVRTGLLQDAKFPDSAFDAVTLLDVLEHVGDPHPLLREIARVLRPGGRVVIKVPNLSYVLAKHRTLRLIPGLVEEVFDAREHLVCYSRRSLTRLLQEEAFHVEVLTVPSPIQSGGWLRRGVRGLGAAAARRLPHRLDTPLAPDILAVGKKPAT